MTFIATNKKKYEYSELALSDILVIVTPDNRDEKLRTNFVSSKI